ncbi:MAG: PD-(D/E)XK nuclease family protein [Bacteroidaceae bacterium]|nr:PD-(D/E)XK nuclease family protein [Bacteroidaceae bacterium]
MKSFLNLIASDLLARFTNDMRDVTVVFPNKRAGMFLSRELAIQNDKPVWAPHYCTIGDLFQSLTTIQQADPMECICILHRIMQEVLGADYTETLDEFWSWGEVLMADFDDIDKHLANAQAIFTNITDQERLNSIDYLESNQRKTLEHFFGHFSLENTTKMKEKFLLTWSHMFEIYTKLHDKLLEEGKLWEGAMFRHVIEQIQTSEDLVHELLKSKRAIVFVGFNVLNNVETSMMKAILQEARLCGQEKALFYWDYDVYYRESRKDHKSGFFMKQNLDNFPNAISELEPFDNFNHLSDVTFIACSTDNAAARYTNLWLKEHAQSKAPRKAVILCNEALMQPVLHAIPKEIEEVNVTMGFPVADTPIHAIIMALLKLQLEGYDANRKRFRYPFEQSLRRQPLFELLKEEDCFAYCGDDTAKLLNYLLTHLRQIALHFAQIEEPNIYEQLYSEAVFRIDKMLCLLRNLTQDKDTPLVILPGTLRRLLRQMMTSAKIPFHSKPDRGLQMMGMLETRCLDFEHMLMLSVEEGFLPRSAHANSFIPETLRKAFGLTTQDHRIAVYEYYFYRLVSRCEHLTCVYNESTSDGVPHEMSRFLTQMLAETKIPIRTLWLRSKPQPSIRSTIEIQKTPEVMERLRQRYDQNCANGEKQVLSASTINAYIECPIRFYLDKVLGIRQEDNLEEGISASTIGTIFHDSVEFFYRRLQEQHKSHDIFAYMLCEKDSSIKPSVLAELELILHTAFDVSWFHPTEAFDRLPDIAERFPRAKEFKANNAYKGATLIALDVLRTYLIRLIRFDAEQAPFSILGTEVDRSVEFDVQGTRLKVGGRVDRIDKTSNHIRIVDYKTGTYHKDDKLVKMENVVGLNDKKHYSYYLQTFLYALAEMESPEAKLHNKLPIKPILFYPIAAANPDYDPSLFIEKVVVDNFGAQHADAFREGMQNILEDIFNPDKPFTCTTNENKDLGPCKYCKLQEICGK